MAYRAQTTVRGLAATSIIGVVPASVVVGDTLLAFLISTSSSATVTTVPSDWILEEDEPGSTDFSIWTYKKVAVASEPSPTWDLSASSDLALVIAAYSGRHQTTPVNASDVSTSPGAVASPYTTPTITPTVDGCDIVCFWALDAASTGRTWDPSPMTERIDTSGTALPLQFCLADEVQATATSISRSAAFSGTSQEITGIIIALAPTVISDEAQRISPDADIVTTGWATAPLWSKIEEETADGTVITGVAS